MSETGSRLASKIGPEHDRFRWHLAGDAELIIVEEIAAAD